MISLPAGGVIHTVGMILTRTTTSLQTPYQLKDYKKNYKPSKSWESQFREFWDSNLGIPGQNDIWALAPWLSTKNAIRGKVGHGESYEFVFAHGLSMHQKCSNYALTNLLFGLCRSVWVIDLLVILPNPHLEALTCPFTPKVLRARERAPTPYLSIVFTFRFVDESNKEFWGASKLVHKKKFKLYRPFTIPSSPFESVSMDFMICFLEWEGTDDILMVVDRFF